MFPLQDQQSYSIYDRRPIRRLLLYGKDTKMRGLRRSKEYSNAQGPYVTQDRRRVCFLLQAKDTCRRCQCSNILKRLLPRDKANKQFTHCRRSTQCAFIPHRRTKNLNARPKRQEVQFPIAIQYEATNSWECHRANEYDDTSVQLIAAYARGVRGELASLLLGSLASQGSRGGWFVSLLCD